MTKEIRFGVKKEPDFRSATWKAHTKKGEVYISCRELGAELQASLHKSGSWHVRFTSEFHKEGFDDEKRPETRFPVMWGRKDNGGPGVAIALRIVVPWTSPVTPIQPGKQLVWIPNAANGNAIYICIVFTSPAASINGWPGKNNGMQLVGSMPVENGDTVWVLHEEAPLKMPSPPPEGKGAGGLFKGVERSALEGDGLKALVYADHSDGSLVIYDLASEQATKRA